MEGNLFTARVLSRTTGPPSSNIVTFCVEGLPGVTYCAYAVSDGAIIVQQSLQPAPAHPHPHHGSHAPRGAPAPPPPPSTAPTSGQFAPVLLIDRVSLEHGSDCFGRLCWGGGPDALLAASTKSHVYFFSLAPFFQAHAHQLPRHAVPSLPLPSTAFVLSGLYRTTMPALAMDFTQAARGLLLTDAGNNVTMLRLVPKPAGVTGLGRSAAYGASSSLAAGAGTAGWGAGAQGTGSGSGAAAGQAQQPVLYAVHEAWRVRADAAHTLAAASQDCYSPCATTTAANPSGGGGPHKVTIWWPAPPDGGGGGGGGGAARRGSGAGASGGDASAVGAEVVRHPVRVLSLEWSPPLAGSRSSAAAPASGSAEAAAPAAPPASIPVGGPPGSAAAAIAASAAAAAASAAALAAPPPAASTAPALMTLGADWVIRIYIEVVMQNMLPPELAASASGMSMSQFCLTLVIEPPALNLTPFSRPGMRACWARPLGSGTKDGGSVAGGGGAGGGAGAAASAAATGLLGDGGEGGEEDGGGGEGGGSRLQWIVASVGVGPEVDPDGLPAIDLGPWGGGQEGMVEAVCVWAVDGLSAVVLSGLPRGSVSAGGKTTASPKAVLWGREQRGVSWLQPAKLLPASPGPARSSEYGISAYVSYPGGMPLLAAADFCIGMEGAYAEVRRYQIAPTAAAVPGTSGHTATCLRIGGLARQAMTGSPEVISSMIVHPAADVALLRDRTGGVALWCLSPLAELPIGIGPAASSAARVLLASVGQLAAVTWLSYSVRQYGTDGPAADYAGGITAYVACVHGRRLLVYAVLLPAATVAAANGGGGGKCDGAGGDTAAAAAAAALAAPMWGAMFVAEVLRTDLPPGVSAVRSLHEASYKPGDGAAGTPSTVTLVAIASRAAASSPRPTGAAAMAAAAVGPTSSRTASGGGAPSPSALRTASAGGAPPPEPPAEQVWLTWQISIPPAPHAGASFVPELHEFDLASEHVGTVAMPPASPPAGIGRAPSINTPREALSGSPSSSSLVCCVCTSIASVVDSETTGGPGGGSSCGRSDASSTVSGSRLPCLMSGTADGRVQFWRTAPDASDGSPSTAGGGDAGGLELVQSSPCRASAALVSGVDPRESIDETETAGSSAGMVVAVALDELSGYAAAATTCGQGEEEEAIYIWRLREDDSCSSSTSSTEPHSPTARAGPAQGDVYELETVVPVDDTVSALSWLAAAGLSACLAVGYASGRVDLLVRDRSGRWEELASYAGAAAVTAFGSARGGAVAVAAGNHLLTFSNALDCADPGQRQHPTLAALAADLSGPLPPYHPGPLLAMLAKGKLGPACVVLRRLLTWLRESASQGREREGGDEEGGDGRGGKEDGGKGASGEVAAAAARQRPPLVIDLQQTVASGLLSSKGLAAFRQALAAPVLTAPPGPAAAAAAASAIRQASAAADDPSAPLRPLFGGGSARPPPTVAATARPPPLAPAPPSGALNTGTLDMSAFGDFGGGVSVSSPPPPPPAAKPAMKASSLETGALDMSAFGGFGGFGGGAPAEEEDPPPPPPVQSLHTGMLDMSAFGDFGATAAPPPPPPPPAPVHALRASALETGTVDMSAFGSFGGAPPAAPQPPVAVPAAPSASALETGTLDMSAFGDFGGVSSSAAPPPEPKSTAPALSPQAALETGTLDMLAFGDFGGFGHQPAPPAPPPPPPPAPPPPEPPSGQPSGGGEAIHTGLLDMSAFGDFGGGAAAPAPPPPPAAASAALHTGTVDLAAFGDFMAAAGAAASPPPPPPVQSLHTGMLDMSAFGDFAGAGSTPPPPPPPPSGAAAATAFARPPPTLRSALEPHVLAPGPPTPTLAPSPASGPAVGPPPAGSSSLLFTPATTNLSNLVTPTVSGPAPNLPSTSTSVAAAAAAAAAATDAWVLFPRVPEPATPPDPALPELLLTSEEVAELHRLLGQDPPDKADPGSTTAAAAPPPTAAQKEREEAKRDGDVADAVAALIALGLTPEDGAELCRLAAALSRRTVDGPVAASSGGSSGGGGSDVIQGLDFAGSVFLVQARLAAAGARAAAAAESAAAGPDDGAFAAAVSRLFRPVSVSRATAPGPPSRALEPSDSASSSQPMTGAPSPTGRQPSGPSAAGPTTAAAGGLRGGGSRLSLMTTSTGLGRMPAGGAAGSPGGGGGGPQRASRRRLNPQTGAWEGGSGGSGLRVGAGGSFYGSRYGGYAGGGGGGGLAGRSRSVRSVLSVLSFASLPDSVAGPRSSMAGGEALEGEEGAGSWWRLVGLLPGLDMRACLAALASGCQAALVEAALPAVPWTAGADEEAQAAPDGRHASAMGGGPANAGPGGSSAASQPRPTLSWPLMRKVGAGFWLADPRALRDQAEALARAQFARRKEPYDCALLYLALGRKALLLSLFRQSSNLKVADFLLKDFTHEEPRRSAAKNAFALLGQHRYELAAAFFILAGQHSDAVGVLVRERRDPQLALLVARLLDASGGVTGPGMAAPPAGAGAGTGLPVGGPVARRLIEQELMPLAVASRDPCAVATLQLLSGQPTDAVCHLLRADSAAAASSLVPAGRRVSGGGTAARTAAPAAVDAAALDFCLQLGVQYLSGKPIPLSVVKSLRRLAVDTSRALEHAGLSAAALEALMVAAALQPPSAADTSAGSGAVRGVPSLPPALNRRYSRLLAACLSYSLGEAQRRQQQQISEQLEDVLGRESLAEPDPTDTNGNGNGNGDGGAAEWRAEACEALSRLASLLAAAAPAAMTSAGSASAAAVGSGGAPPVDEAAVLRLLGRHVVALRRVRRQPLVPPELLVTRPPSAAAAAPPPPPPPVATGHRRQLSELPPFPRTQAPAADVAAAAAAASLVSPPESSHGPGYGPGYGDVLAGASQPLSAESSSSSVLSGGMAAHGALAGSSPFATAAPTPETSLHRQARPGPAGPGGAAGGGGGGYQHSNSQGLLPGLPAAAMGAGSGPGAAGVTMTPPQPVVVMPRLPSQTPPGSPLPQGAGGQVDGTRGKAGEGGTATPGGPAGWGVFEAPWDVLALEGDKCKALVLSRAPRGTGGGDGSQLPFAVATAKSGLVGGYLGPPALAPPPPKTAASGPSSLFLGLMQSVLHHVRWTPDPWAMMAGDFADESPQSSNHAPPSHQGSGGAGGGLPSGPGAGAAGGAGSGGAGGAPGTPHAPLARGGPGSGAASFTAGQGGAGGGGGGAGGVGGGSLGGTSTVALASHPERDSYLSGSAHMSVYAWRFGESVPQGAFIPCAEPTGAAATAAAAAASRAVRSGGFGAGPGGAAAAAAAVSGALDLAAPHWGHAAALAYSTPSGGRFAGIGEGGLVALWRTDVMGPGGLGYADWTHHCVGKHGRAVAFVGDSGSQVLVAGQGERGGLVGWWDSLAPPGRPAAACVAEIRGRKAVPTSLALLRPDAGGVLVFGDEAGELVATDLRMMASKEYIWTIPRAHGGAITSLAQWGPNAAGVLTWSGPGPAGAAAPLPSTPHAQHAAQQQQPQHAQQAKLCNLVASGGKDGSLVLVDISSGKVVSSLERAHASTRTGFPGLLAAAAASAAPGARAIDRAIVRRSRHPGAGVAVGGLACCTEGGPGLLSCGADGVVRYHPLAPQMLDMRAL
ncbi:hypothetical protein HYH03_012902 [Edaphochlamys debaryana]|uniref:RAVE complex protein Rav1 C-terminal domain-containing protein n=1 Tax=Edaphochlamys debaryana TaxID=47281 RepID=A0A835XQV5_9CHLO|nr:hypothetical protein HYH03_012902 [Edaphochlamys debaryana]|eukprot:KAG2488583.1 hypothetical protein HYH03_012902 [Edaphochlamys debaryana]